MTPKEKADELFNKMYQVKDIMGNYPMCFDTAKQCALIAVEEILNHHGQGSGLYRIDRYYWRQVKHELNKL